MGKNEEALHNIVMGRALYRAGKNSEALSAYEMAIRLDPRNADAYMLMAELLIRMGRYKEAIDSINNAIEIKPTSLSNSLLALAYYIKGSALESLKMYMEAIRCYDSAITSEPTMVEAYMRKWICWESLLGPTHIRVVEAEMAFGKALSEREEKKRNDQK